MKASRARHPALSSTKHIAKVLLSRGERSDRDQWQEAYHCKVLLSRGERGERDQWQEATHCSKSNDGWRAGLHLCA